MQETHVILQFGLPEVFVNVVGSIQEFGEVVEADVEGDGHPDGRPEGVASPHPVPELEHVVLGVDSELRHLHLVGGQSDEMLGYGRSLK